MKLRSFMLLVLGMLSIGALFASASAFAADPDLTTANQALFEGRTADAISGYRNLISLGDVRFGSPELWFNRGLAEEKSGDLVAASLSYRRALILDPTMAPALKHLVSVLATLGVPIVENLSDRVFRAVHPDLLILGGALAGWFGLLALIVLLLTGYHTKHYRTGLIALALALVILGHGSFLVGSWSDPRRVVQNEAVITAHSAQPLHATPADSAQVQGTLAPGTLLSILSRNGAWWKVSDGTNTGWIPSNNLTPLLPVSGS